MAAGLRRRDRLSAGHRRRMPPGAARCGAGARPALAISRTCAASAISARAAISSIRPGGAALPSWRRATSSPASTPASSLPPTSSTSRAPFPRRMICVDHCAIPMERDDGVFPALARGDGRHGRGAERHDEDLGPRHGRSAAGRSSRSAPTCSAASKPSASTASSSAPTGRSTACSAPIPTSSTPMPRSSRAFPRAEQVSDVLRQRREAVPDLRRRDDMAEAIAADRPASTTSA